MKLILLGGPGAGKGTQAAMMKDHYGIPHISTGEILREARAAGTALGKKAAGFMDAGKLLPDDLILGIIEERMPSFGSGFLFDGFPRTMAQAEGLDAMLGRLGWALNAVVSIEVPDETVITRLLKRAEIEGRPDDNRETIGNRLTVYHGLTEPLKEYYQKRKNLRSVDGLGSVKEVFGRILTVLGGVE